MRIPVISFWLDFAVCELAALVLLAVAIIRQRRQPSARKRVLVHGLALLQLALPALMLLSAGLFSHEHGVIIADRSAAGMLSFLPFCFYVLQFPVGGCVALLVANRADELKYLATTSSLVAVQMLFSFSVAFLTSLEITGDSF